MTADAHPERAHQFVEEVGLLIERMGMPRTAGRVLGRLLLCDPPQQSSAELARYLGASKGSISTSTRMLMQFGLIERVPVKNTRASYFAVQPATFDRAMAFEAAYTAESRQLLERGLGLFADRPAAASARLRALHSLFALYERELPRIIDLWHQEREKEREKLS